MSNSNNNNSLAQRSEDKITTSNKTSSNLQSGAQQLQPTVSSSPLDTVSEIFDRDATEREEANIKKGLEELEVFQERILESDERILNGILGTAEKIKKASDKAFEERLAQRLNTLADQIEQRRTERKVSGLSKLRESEDLSESLFQALQQNKLEEGF